MPCAAGSKLRPAQRRDAADWCLAESRKTHFLRRGLGRERVCAHVAQRRRDIRVTHLRLDDRDRHARRLEIRCERAAQVVRSESVDARAARDADARLLDRVTAKLAGTDDASTHWTQ